jgi:hypothetical protein
MFEEVCIFQNIQLFGVRLEEQRGSMRNVLARSALASTGDMFCLAPFPKASYCGTAAKITLRTSY